MADPQQPLPILKILKMLELPEPVQQITGQASVMVWVNPPNQTRASYTAMIDKIRGVKSAADHSANPLERQLMGKVFEQFYPVVKKSCDDFFSLIWWKDAKANRWTSEQIGEIFDHLDDKTAAALVWQTLNLQQLYQSQLN